MIQEVGEVFEAARRKLERLEAKTKARAEGGDEVMALLTLLPA